MSTIIPCDANKTEALRDSHHADVRTWLLAASPISRSVSVKATYEGVVRLPMSLAAQKANKRQSPVTFGKAAKRC